MSEPFQEDEGLASERAAARKRAVEVETGVRALALSKRQNGEYLSDVAIAAKVGCTLEEVRRVKNQMRVASIIEVHDQGLDGGIIRPVEEPALEPTAPAVEVTPATPAEQVTAPAKRRRRKKADLAETQDARDVTEAVAVPEAAVTPGPEADSSPLPAPGRAARLTVDRLLDLFAWESEAEADPALADLAAAVRQLRMNHKTHNAGGR